MLFSAVNLGSLARPILSMPHELGTCQEFHKVSTIIFACGDEFTEYVDIFGWALQNPLNSNLYILGYAFRLYFVAFKPVGAYSWAKKVKWGFIIAPVNNLKTYAKA